VIDLPDRSINAVARIVRIERDGLLAFAFTDIGLGARERVIRLVSKTQQEREQAG
jgi:hypothetical protein